MDATGGSRAAKKRQKRKKLPEIQAGRPSKRDLLGSDSDDLRKNKHKRPRNEHDGQSNGHSEAGSDEEGMPPFDHDQSSADQDSDNEGLPNSLSVSSNGKGAQHKEKKDKGKGKQRSSAPAVAVPYVITVNANDERDAITLGLPAHDICADPELDSGVKARQLLQWILAPLDVESFYADYWEKQAVVIQRGKEYRNYFKGWLSTSDIKQWIQGHSLRYGTDLDVTNFVKGKRITLNPVAEGDVGGDMEADEAPPAPLVDAAFVWEQFGKGCSLRMPCPQKICDPLHSLLSSLEEEWGCMVGSNVYLTPAGYQGFAPHYDDIEAFLLQIEGSKRWRVYKPVDESTELPQTSSGNLTEEEVALLGPPVIDVVLEPCDTLYFPRGWVHQAVTVAGGKPSLHLTISSYQGNSWADLLATAVPTALELAAQKYRSLRQGLPREYLNYVGVAAGEGEGDPRRAAFIAEFKERMKLVLSEALEQIDITVDEMGKKYISDRLPPTLADEEEAKTVVRLPTPPWGPESRVKCVRRGIARLLVEEGMAVVYHAMDNARVHHGCPLRPLEFELDDAPTLEVLLSAHPDPVAVKNLPHPPADDIDDKLDITKSLYAEGFLSFEGNEPQDGEEE